MARDIAIKIEQELKYPGEIKVTMIRETPRRRICPLKLLKYVKNKTFFGKLSIFFGYCIEKPLLYNVFVV